MQNYLILNTLGVLGLVGYGYGVYTQNFWITLAFVGFWVLMCLYYVVETFLSKQQRDFRYLLFVLGHIGVWGLEGIILGIWQGNVWVGGLGLLVTMLVVGALLLFLYIIGKFMSR